MLIPPLVFTLAIFILFFKPFSVNFCPQRSVFVVSLDGHANKLHNQLNHIQPFIYLSLSLILTLIKAIKTAKINFHADENKSKHRLVSRSRPKEVN